MSVRLGKKFSFQSAAENLQRRLWPDRLRQTVPDRCSSRWKGAVANDARRARWSATTVDRNVTEDTRRRTAASDKDEGAAAGWTNDRQRAARTTSTTVKVIKKINDLYVI